MHLRRTLLASTLFLVACGAPAGTDHGKNGGMDGSTGLAMDRLNASPRHQEWVDVTSGDRIIHTFVVYPQVSNKAPVVLLIHENKGLSDWVRGMADEVAEAGYIAVAPDLLSSFDATRDRTSDFADSDAVTQAIYALKPEQVANDLAAVADWAKALPATNGKLVSAGFCWGGAQSFGFATQRSDLAAALVFYGTGPTDAAAYASITAPVFGFYGGADDRINATIEATADAMSAAGKTFDYHVYDNAGHAFMRLGEDPAGTPDNIAARTAAWDRLRSILQSL